MTELTERWRADTPGCAHVAHLNNAGAGLMPAAVIAAVQEHIALEGRIGGYEAADEKSGEIARAYGDVARLIGAQERNVAIVANATAGFVQSLTSFDFASGDVILTTRADYTSYQIHYLSLAKRLGVRIVHANDLPEGGVDPQSVRELIMRTRPRLVHVSWIPTHSGIVQDAEGVGAVCEEYDVPYLVDACQAVGQRPVDVAALRCDYLSATARKFLRGPRGIGFMYASDRALARGDFPLFVDMRGATWAGASHFELAPTARRFEDWEFPYALVLGLGEATRYALEVGAETAHVRATELARLLRSELAGRYGIESLDRGREQCAIVTAQVPGWDAADLVARLRRERINTSATLRWFGLLDFERSSVQSAVRLSPHYYNTKDEVFAAAAALGQFLHGR